jgi:hypothetical protein
VVPAQLAVSKRLCNNCRKGSVCCSACCHQTGRSNERVTDHYHQSSTSRSCYHHRRRRHCCCCCLHWPQGRLFSEQHAQACGLQLLAHSRVSSTRHLWCFDSLWQWHKGVQGGNRRVSLSCRMVRG